MAIDATHTVFLLALLLLLTDPGHGIRWLSLHSLKKTWTQPEECPATKEEKRVFGFVNYQTELCRRMTDLMPFVKAAADDTVAVCQETFRRHRWNCSSLVKAPFLEHDLTKGTREQAFVYALSAAAIAHQIAKACAQGKLMYCKCGTGDPLVVRENNELPTDESFRWQGCSDDVRYGLSASREWADASWRPKLRMSRDLGPGGELLGPEELAFAAAIAFKLHTSTQPPPTPVSGTAELEKRTDTRKLHMNQQNNDVGREVVVQSQMRKCKCHGVSSSCQIQTCWNTLPPLADIGQRLHVKYLQAQQLKPKSHFLQPSSTPPPSDLVYIKPSSDYCDQTRHRECNGTDPTMLDSCQNLCCDRGHQSKVQLVSEQCFCKYIHCCFVRCRKCTYYVQKSYCN